MAEGFPSVVAWWRLSLRRGFSSARQLFATALLAGLLVSALGVPVFLVARAVAEQQAGAGSQLNTLRVETPAASLDSGITTATLAGMAQIPGVSAVVVDLKATIYGAGDQTWDANIQVIRPWLPPPGVTTQQLTGDQVIVPDVIDGVAMTSLLGTSVPITYVRGTGQSTGEQAGGQVRIVGTYPATWSGYGPDAVLGSQELVVKLYAARYAQQPSEVLERSGVSGAWVQVYDQSQVEPVGRALRAQGFDVTSERDRLGALPGLLASFPVILAAVAVGMAVLLSVQILQSVRVGLEQRAREFGLLRMRGYRVADVRRLVTLEVVSSVTFGAVVGVLAGAGVGLWLAAKLTPKELVGPLGWVPLASALPLLALVVVGLAALAVAFALFATQRIMRHDPFLLVMRG